MRDGSRRNRTSPYPLNRNCLPDFNRIVWHGLGQNIDASNRASGIALEIEVDRVAISPEDKIRQRGVVDDFRNEMH